MNTCLRFLARPTIAIIHVSILAAVAAAAAAAPEYDCMFSGFEGGNELFELLGSAWLLPTLVVAIIGV